MSISKTTTHLGVDMIWTATNGTKTRTFSTWIKMMTFLEQNDSWSAC